MARHSIRFTRPGPATSHARAATEPGGSATAPAPAPAKKQPIQATDSSRRPGRTSSSVRAKRAGPKAGANPIAFWADVWASGRDEELPGRASSEAVTGADGGGGAAREVPLQDLIAIRPARAARSARKEPDFELVPDVRRVIVLDDRAEVPEPEEAWEVVSSIAGDEDEDDKDAHTVLSYADIVAHKFG